MFTLCIGGIYLLISLPQTLSIDSLAYAYSVREVDHWFHPHHILFVPSARGLYILLKSIFPTVEAVYAMQLHNIVFTLLLVWISMKFFRKIGSNGMQTALFGFLLIVCNSVWKMTGCCEVYVPSLFFSVCLMYYLFAKMTIKYSIIEYLIASILLTLSILYHQLGIFTCIALVGMGKFSYGWKGFFKNAFIIVIAGCFTLVVYILVVYFHFSTFSFKLFNQYVFYYTYYGSDDWGSLSNFSVWGLLQLIRGFTLGFFNGKVAGVVFYQILTGILVLGSITCLLFQNRINNYGPGKILFKTMVVWLAGFIIFIMWWIPGEGEFFVTPTWIILVFTLLLLQQKKAGKTWKRIVRSYLILYGGLLLVINVPLELSSPYKPWRLKEEVCKIYNQVPEDAVVIDGYMETIISRYYLNRKVLDVNFLNATINDPDNAILKECHSKSKVIPVKYLIPGDPDVCDYLKKKMYWLVDLQMQNDGSAACPLSFKTIWIDGEAYFMVGSNRILFEDEEEFNLILQKQFEGVDKTIGGCLSVSG